ncbi:hypothetical protein VE03_04880 [Pseudogymnoascus sp. 23342-1-I1]|nr:hypothetical protein VE03_04880 [Pseudogymnoascus sp. 23342-1-I1]
MDTLLDSGKYSDLRITCKDRTWNVHRAVICTASPVFAAMIDGEFKEAQNGVIDLPADEPEIVELMLRFLYQGKYNDARPTAQLTRGIATAVSDDRGGLKLSPPVKLREEAMTVNVEVYVTADKYNMPLLKKYAFLKYKEIFNQVMTADVAFECSVHCLQKNQ